MAVKLSAVKRGYVVHSFAGDDPIVCCDWIDSKLGRPKFTPTPKVIPLDAMIGAAMQAAAERQMRKPPRPEAIYKYEDKDGTLLYEVLRLPGKKFMHRLPDGDGGWLYKGSGRRVVYHWRELLEFPSATVFVCEGEKDTDNVRSIGLCATTVASGKWTDDCVSALAGRDCWIIQDCDEVGEKKAVEVAMLLHPVATSIKIIRLPGLTGEKHNKDVSDWLDQGHTKDELINVCADAPDWHPADDTSDESIFHRDTAPAAETPPPKAEPAIALSYFSDLVDAKPKDWLIKSVIARGECSSWIAPPGKGKSALLTDMFVHGAHGVNWRGYRTKVKFGGIYFALERADLVRRRMAAHRLRDNLPADLPIAISGQVIDLMGRKFSANVVDAIKRAEDKFGLEIGLVGFDTYAKGIAAGGGDESSAKDQNAALANLRRVLDKVNIHIATIGHTGKDESRGERGSNAKLADADLQVQITGDAIRSAIVKKANDQPEGLLTSFRLEPFDFGLDDDGDPFRTYIVSQEDVAPLPATDKLSDKQKLAIDCLAEVTLSHGVDLALKDGMPAGLKSVTADQWHTELCRRGVLDPQAANPRARFSELRTRLAARRVIGVDGDLVWLALRR
jgi:hypothetical protein